MKRSHAAGICDCCDAPPEEDPYTISRARYDELNARALAGPSRFLSSYHPEPYYWLSFDRKSPGLVFGYIEGEESSS